MRERTVSLIFGLGRGSGVVEVGCGDEDVIRGSFVLHCTKRKADCGVSGEEEDARHRYGVLDGWRWSRGSAPRIKRRRTWRGDMRVLCPVLQTIHDLGFKRAMV